MLTADRPLELHIDDQPQTFASPGLFFENDTSIDLGMLSPEVGDWLPIADLRSRIVLHVTKDKPIDLSNGIDLDTAESRQTIWFEDILREARANAQPVRRAFHSIALRELEKAYKLEKQLQTAMALSHLGVRAAPYAIVAGLVGMTAVSGHNITERVWGTPDYGMLKNIGYEVPSVVAGIAGILGSVAIGRILVTPSMREEMRCAVKEDMASSPYLNQKGDLNPFKHLMNMRRGVNWLQSHRQALFEPLLSVNITHVRGVRVA